VPERDATVVFKSLSGKISAVVFGLVAAMFAAEVIVGGYVGSAVHEGTERLVADVRGGMVVKDKLIANLIGESVGLEEAKLKATQAQAELEATAKAEREKSFLHGKRVGVSTSIMTLIRGAMMSGEATTAENIMATLLEDPNVYAVNLWRVDGTLAFRDNKTIDAINKLTGSETFQRRQAKPGVAIPPERAGVLAEALKKPTEDTVLPGTVERDRMPVPVLYSYYVLDNDEPCQGCHGETKQPRGVLEIAVSRADLIRLEEESESDLKAMVTAQSREREEMKARGATRLAEAKAQSEASESALAAAVAALDAVLDRAGAWRWGALLVLFALIVAATLALLRTLLTAPLHSMTDVMHRLAEGDTTITVPGSGRSDEIGNMATAVQVFKENAVKVRRLQTEQEESRAAAEAERRETMNHLADDFESNVGGIVERVSQAAGQMQGTARSMSDVSAGASRKATTVAAAAEQASTNVQTVASAAEELSASISEISRQVAQSSEISRAAVREAERTNDKVQGLAEAASKIGEVVKLINDIAEQTNLLALNATIEAARAGEAGKGFAVVAGEVKNLANQTAKATEEISAQVAGIQGATQEAVGAIQSIGKTISQINEIAAAIAAAVEEQGAATREIARNVQQAAAGTTQVSTHIADVNQAAQDAGTASGQVLDAADELTRYAEQLRQEVRSFIAQVRTG
jgi:methyl-accepting chemotaxis protein